VFHATKYAPPTLRPHNTLARTIDDPLERPAVATLMGTPSGRFSER
jgi:hypothetical protein